MNNGQPIATFLGIAAGLVVASYCGAGCPIHVPADFPTINAAIDAGGCGEIIVAPGTYNEIIIGFVGIIRSSDGPDVTIIDGSGFNSSVITCGVAGSCGTLEGFTITGGIGPGSPGGGGWLNQNSISIVINCKFVGNTVAGNGPGGAMSNSNSSPTLINCTFIENTASNGGAIFNSVNSFPTITNCFFGGNSAGGGQGGAILSPNGALPVITDSLFCENTPNAIVGAWDDKGGNEFSGDCDDFLDCNGNGIFDVVEVAKGLADDVNGNGIPDDCDCLPDINGSGDVTVIDLVRLLICFGLPAAGGCEAEDINFDGTINVLDLINLLLAFGTTCP